MNFGAHQLAEQKIACDRGRDHSGRHDVIFQSRLRTSSGDEPCLIRVVMVDIDDGVVPAFENVGDLEFEVSALVAAKCQSRGVITLNQHSVRHRNTLIDQRLTKSVEWFEARVQVRKLESWQLFEFGAEMFLRNGHCGYEFCVGSQPQGRGP